MLRFLLPLLLVYSTRGESCESHLGDLTISSETTQLPCRISGNLEFDPDLTALNSNFDASTLTAVGGAVCITNSQLTTLPEFTKLESIGSARCSQWKTASIVLYNSAVIKFENPFPSVISIPGDVIFYKNPNLEETALGGNTIKKAKNIFEKMRLIFLIDVDTTMGTELQSVKETVSATVDDIAQRDDIMQVDFVVIPFTEYGHGCFASIHEFSDPSEAKTFTDDLQLGTTATLADPNFDTTGKDDVTTVTSLAEFTGNGYTEIVLPFQYDDYVTGTASYPMGFSPSYSTDGGTSYQDIEPLSGITHIKFQGALSGKPGMLVDIPKPIEGSVASSNSGGDGFEPLLLGRRVYNIYHHTGAKMICTLMDNGARCGSGAAGVMSITINGVTPYASNAPVGYADRVNDRIYFPSNMDREVGWVCVDTNGGGVPTYCPIGGSDMPYNGWIKSLTESSTRQFGWGYPDYAQLRLYTISSAQNNVIHCLDVSDPTAPKRCDSFPATVSDISISTRRLQLMPKTTKLILASSNEHYCVDTAKGNARCDGWSGKKSGGQTVGQPVPFMNDRGVAIGWCAYSGSWKCFSLATGEATTANDGEVHDLLTKGLAAINTCGQGLSQPYQRAPDHTHLAFYEKRTYVAFGGSSSSASYCCFENGELCNNFPHKAPYTHGIYGVVIDPANRGGCHWGLGHSGVLISFSTINPEEACASADPVFYVTPQDSYCNKDGSAIAKKWDSIELLNADATNGDFDDVLMTVSDMNDAVLFSGVSLKDGIVSLDNKDITGSTGTLKFTLQFDNPANDLFDVSDSRPLLPQVDIRWDGDPMEVCVTAKSEIKPQFCAYDGHGANALELLEDMTPAVPSIVFMFTNKDTVDSTSTTRESAITMLEKLMLQFEGLLVMNPVVPDGTADTATFGYYAKMSDGMLLQPKDGSSSTQMATGLTSIIMALLEALEGEEPAVSSFEGFDVYDVSQMTLDSVTNNERPSVLPENDIEEVIVSSIDTTAEISISAEEYNSMSTIEGSFVVSENDALESFNADGLETVGADFTLENNNNMEWERLGNLESVGGDYEVSDSISSTVESCGEGFEASFSLGGCLCPANHFKGADSACAPCSTCPEGYSEVQRCTATLDRTCVKGTKAPTASTSAPTISPTLVPAVDDDFLVSLLGVEFFMDEGDSSFVDPTPEHITQLVANANVTITGSVTDSSYIKGEGWPMEGAKLTVACEEDYAIDGEEEVEVVSDGQGGLTLSSVLPSCSKLSSSSGSAGNVDDTDFSGTGSSGVQHVVVFGSLVGAMLALC